MKSTYSIIQSVPANTQALNLSLSTYKSISTYYRAGDNSNTNLEPYILAISKENLATVNESSSKNYIINGKSNSTYCSCKVLIVIVIT